MRQRLYAEIETERQAQDALWGGPAFDDLHTPWEWIALLTRHAGLAVNDGATEADVTRFRKQMVRTAALAVAAIESMDRKTGRQAVAAGAHTAGSGF